MHKLVTDIARTIASTPQAHARAIVVGGYVRDKLLGVASKDIDVEVFGLDIDALKNILSRYGEVIEVGRAFGVLRIKGLDVDFSLPRRDSKIGPGHRGFDVQIEPGLSFEQAARRRDLTVNSIGFDPLTGVYLDPHGGRDDLQNGRLRATDPTQFSDDPLRAIRVAQFAARLQMQADSQLVDLCRQLDLREVSPERMYAEMEKLLIKGQRPSLGFKFLRQAHLLRYFPELHRLIDVPQDAEWHPEGDVWVHTLMVVDEAAGLRGEHYDDSHALMFGALCHDFGKPATTVVQAGRIRSLAHDVGGVEPTREFLGRLRTPKELIEKVVVLVRYHLAPALYVANQAGSKGYRRLARKLHSVGLTLQVLADVAKADHFGRTTAQALRREFPELECFLRQAELHLHAGKAPDDLVSGRHLLARGLPAGKLIGTVLKLCRDLQDEQDWSSADALIDAALEQLENQDQ